MLPLCSHFRWHWMMYCKHSDNNQWNRTILLCYLYLYWFEECPSLFAFFTPTPCSLELWNDCRIISMLIIKAFTNHVRRIKRCPRIPRTRKLFNDPFKLIFRELYSSQTKSGGRPRELTASHTVFSLAKLVWRSKPQSDREPRKKNQKRSQWKERRTKTMDRCCNR